MLSDVDLVINPACLISCLNSVTICSAVFLPCFKFSSLHIASWTRSADWNALHTSAKKAPKVGYTSFPVTGFSMLSRYSSRQSLASFSFIYDRTNPILSLSIVHISLFMSKYTRHSCKNALIFVLLPLKGIGLFKPYSFTCALGSCKMSLLWVQQVW